jgi:hypothetical protein
MKTSMKACVLGMVLAVCAAAAHAGSITDPVIVIRDPVGCPSHACVTIGPGQFTFSFQVPSSGFGVLNFLNASGATWKSLILTETGVAAANITCSAPGVFSCTVVALGSNAAKIVLTATAGFTGVPNGNSFEIVLGCVNSTCWPGNLSVSAAANAVPEPGTVALMLTGLGVLFLLVTRRKLGAKALAA